MTLLVDPRVGSKHLCDRLRAMGLPAEHTTLEYGDVAFCGNGPNEDTVLIGIEVKTFGDLVSSMESGRLSGHQLPGLLASYRFVWLIVEGVWRLDEGGGILVPRAGGWAQAGHGQRHPMYRDVDHYLTTLEVIARLKVRRSGSVAETVKMIADLYSWWQKAWSAHRGHQAFDESADFVLLRKPTLVMRVAKELPGVGWERAQAAAREFPTVMDMISATAERWREVEGVGKVTAQKVVDAVRQEEKR